tara:strand:+ start:68 stop:271 length:204 start_codon:yes stop_codon:yes gene_type:complete
MGVIMEDHEKIIKLAKIDVLEMIEVLKTCNTYLDKIPDGLLSEKYDLKFRVNHLFTVLDSEVKINNE